MNLSSWSHSTTRRCARPSAYAIDRETLCAEVRSGDCLPTVSCIPPGLPGAIETDKFAFDPEAAKQALAESSYGGPDNLPEIKLYYNSERSGATNGPSGSPGQYRDILGIELILEPTDGTTLDGLAQGQRRRIRSSCTSAAGTRTTLTRRTG